MARKKSAAKKAREAEAASAPAAPTEPTPIQKEVKPKPTPQPEISDSESEESSEEEDEYGDLITEDVESGINNVLDLLKTDPKKLLDPNTKFFHDPESITYQQQTKKEKPLYLKDYHRETLLSGSYQDEETTVDGEKSYNTMQREDRDQLLQDIKQAFNEDDEDDEEDFLHKKEKPREEVTDIPVKKLPNPAQDPDSFLSAFLDNQAWIPKKGDKVINLDKIEAEDEDAFDNAVDSFEHAYNFRYEDPNAAEIVSYARNQATLRRSNTNSRKRQREKKLEVKEKEEKEVEELVKKKKTSKLNKVIDRLSKIKQAVGDQVNDEVIEKVFGDSLLQDDFDDADWDSKMAEIFNEQYYEAENVKPEWDEDDEIMADYYEEEEQEEEEEPEEEEPEEPSSKKSKKEKLKEKKSAKKEKQSVKEKAQQIIEANSLKIIDEVEEERGRSKNQEEVKFKYREVSPESFGLTTRDIILADDKELNSFIGIKKFAPYRPKELRKKDKRKYTKKKMLQEWRKEVFHNKHRGKVPEEAKENEIWIPNEDVIKESRKEKRKHKR
ncbi:Protein KRI1 [Spathaspora sp. JA1]|nr:Protein KRI1 [Spathaspora sp. JA1]